MITVKVTPQRMKVIIGLGCSEGSLATAEALSRTLGLEVSEVLDAMDGLLTAGVVEDVDVEEFYLTEYGSSLFHAVYDATGLVLGGRDGRNQD